MAPKMPPCRTRTNFRLCLSEPLTIILLYVSGARSLHQTKVLDAAENVLQGATSAVRNGLKTLVTDLFGPENSFFTQIPQEIKSLCKRFAIWPNLTRTPQP